MYSHTQRSWLFLGLLAGFGVAALLAGIFVSPDLPLSSRAPLLGSGVVLILLAYLFSSLKVTVAEGTVHVRFGPGLFSRRFKKEDVLTSTRVKNKWYYGWGIRLTPHGWMFNIGGMDAVELHLKDGKKFRIGTDDPEGLLRALK